ncbi:MAG: response regulator [Ferruginibacter sp.]
MEKKYHILIVDDDHGTIEIISMILLNAGYQITADPTAELFFLESGINPDLILLDNQVGEKCGALLCHELKQNEKTRNIPIVLISGIDELQRLAESACADDFLTKPFSIKNLLQKVEACLLQRTVTC